MKLILTHEQADFDAAGSLLAARLLDPESHAVLPRRLNRNLRGFLTLYGDRLPLTTFDDLPRRRVEHVTLVDTQVLPSVKGVQDSSRIHVVDHHPRSPELSPAWTAHIQEVGATTTLLAESLEAAGSQLDPIEATLLLIGIYEDTGSLSYSGTTARDVRSVGWLLDQGASLVLAGEFLDHPLTDGQREVLDRLVGAAESLTVHGVSIIVACASAQGLTDEISTLAHKLRDLFDPAGLFVLVGLDGHVQLVARSSSASVNVARISERFGGGGHSRAAAALIRNRKLEEVRRDLLALLPEMVQPARTVADIMSGTPHLLGPEVSIGEAADRMRRFGHEGYPVVEAGRVVGLLTRRAVDKAIAHGLADRPVRSAMDPGSLVAYPDESVEQLQRAMIEHDWGQVAVADRARGDVIGIVTRTDLLRSLAGETWATGEPSMADELERSLPAGRRQLLHRIGQAAESQRVAVYVVGGFVRDLLLGQPGMDFDLVVEGDAIALARALADSYGGRVSSHRRFGTAKWRLDPEDERLQEALDGNGSDPGALPETLDLVSARAEFYSHPTALPSVRLGSIKLDLHRRDFSINTLAIRLDGAHFGQLLDPWGGGRDLRLRQIRALHSISFIDDPTRMLRAVRLEQRLGFEIEPRTLELARQALPLLHRVSGERLRNELELIFEEPRLSEVMARLHALGLLEAIDPALTWDSWLEARFEAAGTFAPDPRWRLEASPPANLLRYGLWVVRLGAEKAAGLGRRLRLTQHDIKILRDGAALVQARQVWSGEVATSERVHRLEEAPTEAVVVAWIAISDDDRARSILQDYLVGWRHIEPALDGHALRARGIPPGPAYSRILTALRDARLDGVVSSEAEELAWLDRWLPEAGVDG